jgi:hypothetical protein
MIKDLTNKLSRPGFVFEQDDKRKHIDIDSIIHYLAVDLQYPGIFAIVIQVPDEYPSEKRKLVDVLDVDTAAEFFAGCAGGKYYARNGKECTMRYFGSDWWYGADEPAPYD